MYLYSLAQVEGDADGEGFEAHFLIDVRKGGRNSQIDIVGAPLS